jgi:hypothetical protein
VPGGSTGVDGSQFPSREGADVPLPKTKPAFFRSDRQPSWRSALIDAWLWLRLRFHRNPGFVTAAVAGSWGSYWYNGFVYASDITKGIEVFRLEDRSVRAKSEKTDLLNPQTLIWTGDRGKKHRRW